MIEIDFLWVGEKANTGDAITCRFTDPATGQDVVIVIDGGFVETGDRIASHVRQYYGTSRVDLVICTHPDDDHIRGLFAVIEELDVARLLIHRPAEYGYTGDNVKSGLVDDLITTARNNGTTVDGGFAGTTYFGGASRLQVHPRPTTRKCSPSRSGTAVRPLRLSGPYRRRQAPSWWRFAASGEIPARP